MSVSESSDAFDAEYMPMPEMSLLPAEVKGRVNALKNLQLNTIKAESEYYREVKQLELKYEAKFNEINRQRAKVITGNHEPSQAESEWQRDLENEDVEDLSEKVKELAVHPDFPKGVKGIPKFWLHVLKNANFEHLMGFIEPHDEEVLAHLIDLSVSLKKDGFVINFKFEENIFFANQVLTKEYTYSDGPNPNAPLAYDGPEIISAKGCTIDWKAGKDVTALVEKIGDMCEHGVPRTVRAASFFEFFDPPCAEVGDCEEGSHDKAALAMDFEIGLSIKDKIIPRAVLFFTGEIVNEDFDESFSETSDSDGELSDEDGVPTAGSRRTRMSRIPE